MFAKPGDPAQLIVAISIKSIDVPKWVESLPQPKLMALDSYVNKHSKYLGTDQAIKGLMEFVAEHEAIED